MFIQTERETHTERERERERERENIKQQVTLNYNYLFHHIILDRPYIPFKKGTATYM